MPLRVLVACEMSGRVRDAFAVRGFEAWSADLLETEAPVRWTTLPDGSCSEWEDYPGFHYQGDCRDLFDWNHPVNADRQRAASNHYWSHGQCAEIPLWDLIIAHPPCDHLTYAGARWFKAKQADGRQQAAADFFMEMTRAPSPLVAVENPHCIMQKPEYAGPPDQIVQPYWFGDPFAKGIHLWLKGLPHLKPTELVTATNRAATGGGSWRTDQSAGRMATNRYEDGEGRARRSIVRSRTFPGFAAAMAEQWGAFAEEHYREPGQ